MKTEISTDRIVDQEVTIQDQIDDLLLLLVKERKKRKISQSELSIRTKIPQPTISRLESFSSVPTLPIVLKLSNALGLKLTLVNNGE